LFVVHVTGKFTCRLLSIYMLRLATQVYYLSEYLIVCYVTGVIVIWVYL